eukprot:19028-Eustigmatos_ZCMA.PRE.1
MCLETPGNAYGDQLIEKARKVSSCSSSNAHHRKRYEWVVCVDSHGCRQVLRDGAGLPLLFPLHDLGFRYEPSAPESLEPLVDCATLISR